MQHLGKGALRVAKNYTKGYSETQAKVRDATSNDPTPPTGIQLNEIAQLTFNQTDFIEIMEMLDKRLNDKGKNWRHVFKSLTVLDYCLHSGSQNVVIYFRDNMYIIKTLKEFQYIDEEGKDQGANVRQKAKDITNLLMDPARLKAERRARANMRDRMLGGEGSSGGDRRNEEDENSRRRERPARARGAANAGGDEDAELRKAIEESKRTAALEKAKQNEESELAQALKLSEEEEARRNKAVEDSNASSLFDDQQQLAPPSDTLIQRTDPSLYTHGLQPQVQPQFTSFNPYQQQAQQEAMQAEYLRQQQEWQQLQFQQQQQAQAQLQAQAQAQAQAQEQEEWMRQQMLQQQQQQQQAFFQSQQSQLVPQPTGFGSNNPFAPSTPSPAPPLPSFPTSRQNQNQRPVEFNLQGTFSNQPSSTLSPTPPPKSTTPSGQGRPSFRPAKKADDGHEHLADLFANREDGQDTFGNIGSLRYGQTEAGRLVAQKTAGNNPFAAMQNPQQQQQQQQPNETPFFDI